jgi:hypothetical protein
MAADRRMNYLGDELANFDPFYLDPGRRLKPYAPRLPCAPILTNSNCQQRTNFTEGQVAVR